ncbi:MAG TPA: hypothetical protein VFV68_03075 [Agriterribacter sp.]|nr:hypothetical protein [Agriterribacter sp.]
MKRILSLAAITLIIATGCRKIEVDGSGDSGGNGSGESNILSGKITADRTLKAGTTYLIRGVVYVVDGTTLTIEPGTRIEGEKDTRGALVITRGTKLVANGTKDKPIIFTSNASSPSSGDWGGIVLLGRARTNNSFNGTAGIGEIEGGINNADGLGLYGGADDNDNSGSLQYVRIEYAGYAFLPDKELNSLTLGSVGSGTAIDYIQVTYALDDAFEWFGGAVNCSHLIAYKTLDDDFDTDNGFRGRIQFGIVLRDSSRADISKVESFESDNDANGSELTPQTAPVFSNITSIGPREKSNNIGNTLFLAGAQLRRNTSTSIFNSVIMGWPTGLLIDASKGIPIQGNITAGNLVIENTTIAGCATPTKFADNTTTPTGWTNADVSNWFGAAASKNEIYADNADVKLAAPFNYGNPDFTPQTGSPLLNSASFTSNKLSESFTPVTFRGAVGAAGTPEGDWWKGWTSFVN